METLEEGETIGRFNGLTHQIYLLNLPSPNNYYTVEVSAKNNCYIDLSFSNSVQSISQIKPKLRNTNKTFCKLKIYPDQLLSNLNIIGVKTSKNEFSEFKIQLYQFPMLPICVLCGSYKQAIQGPCFFSYLIRNPSFIKLQISIKPSNLAVFFSVEDRYPDFNSIPIENQEFQSNNSANNDPLSILPQSDPTNCFSHLNISSENFQSDIKTVYFQLIIQDLTEVEITIKELTQENLLPAGLLDKKRIFDSIFGDNDGNQLLKTEENWKNLKKMTEFTYGEIEFLPIVPVLEFCDLGQNKIFWDLGCGTGKCMAAAALFYNNIQVKGVEYLNSLYSQCVTNMNKLERILTVNVIFGDLCDIDWSDADLLYCANICFPSNLNLMLAGKMKLLKIGSKAILLKKLDLPDYVLLASFDIQMSWGVAPIFVYEKQEQFSQ